MGAGRLLTPYLYVCKLCAATGGVMQLLTSSLHLCAYGHAMLCNAFMFRAVPGQPLHVTLTGATLRL